MHRALSTPNPSHIFGNRLVLIAGLAAAAAGCTTVGGHLTGVRLDRVSPTTCIRSCNDLYAGLIDQELKLREENLASCATLPQPQRGACLEEEGVRHAAEMDRLARLKQDCLGSCAKPGSVPG